MSSRNVIIIRNAAKSDFGGGERMPVFIARELKQYNLNPIMLSSSKKLLHFAQQQGVKHVKSWWWPRQDWSGRRALLFPVYVLWQVILSLYYFVVFVTLRPTAVSLQSKDDFIAGTFAARALGIKVSWVDHGDLKAIWMNHEVWYKNPVGKFVYLASYGVHTIAIASESERALIIANIPNSPVTKKLKLIYNGTFDLYGHSRKTIDFISTGRLVTDKGISELIEAFAKLIRRHPTATLAIVGDGPEREKFERQSVGIPGITFYGHQTEPLRFLEKSKIFVLPTYHEAFGVAVVEACMEELAIIATDIGGIPEIIDDKKNGLLVPTRDSDALYETMNYLYENTKLQRSLGKSARRKFLSTFNLDEIIKNDYLPLFIKDSSS